MRIGYLKGAEEAANGLKKRGWDVAEYSRELAFDALLYNSVEQTSAFDSISAETPMMLFNVSRSDLSALEKQLGDRSYTRLFE